MDLDRLELKFLLHLLGYPDYRAPISQIKPNPKTPASERDTLCRRLAKQGLVDFSEEILQFAIAPPGRVLLNLDTTSLPVTPDELLVLQACVDKTIALGDLPKKLAFQDDRSSGNSGSDPRQGLVRTLSDRGLISVRKTQLKEVWLTPEGILYLRDECAPRGTANVLSFDLLTDYLRFLRKTLEPEKAAQYGRVKPTPEQVLEMICQIDRDLNTDNYLPLCYLRDQLQPPLSREEFDQTLYFLQRNDLIELGSIQEVSAYSPEQLKAGIPQNVGGALFFVSVVRD